MSAAMFALLAAGQLIDYGVFNLRIKALNTDTHASVFGVASLLAEVAAAAAITWRAGRAERRRWTWFALGALVAALVLFRGLASFDAATLAAPLACVLFLVCWLTWSDPPAARTVVWGALVLMVTSLAMHQVGQAADVVNHSGYSWGYQLTTVAKHGCELAGWLLLGTGIIAGMQGRPAHATTRARNAAPEMGSFTP